MAPGAAVGYRDEELLEGHVGRLVGRGSFNRALWIIVLSFLCLKNIFIFLCHSNGGLAG